ncbi:hypothetical protein DFH07DRAFT_828280 [Mycena maculata]|uniref:F-box domain-containing protein n=1 Tax=Mycena maculata TaxID=230809 RepID=A0AAD7N871_9AGAR|nr:hypothetical protein DFH07DRAFT_828280 [Mycena maculata]
MTRGYRVYRYKGYYHVRYKHCWDSYPEDLGIKVAAEIPRDPEAYRIWRDRLREELGKAFEQSSVNGSDGPTITKEQPQNDIMIEWIYEIDLDHEVFLVDSFPLFSLQNMPESEASFLDCIGVDSYGVRSYSASTPEKHRYNWKSPPPSVDNEVMSLYEARQPYPDCSELSIDELLGEAAQTLGTCEAVRIGLYEVLVNAAMRFWVVAHGTRVLESLPDRTHISGELLSMGIELVRLAFGRMLFGKAVKFNSLNAVSYSPGFPWLAPDICLRITTHLDDERNVKKNILQLVDEISRHRRPGNLAYGIIFSFFHCLIIQVDEDNRFKSTAPMQFMPSYHTTSPSTPGITAVARVAYRSLITRKLRNVRNTLPPTHFLNHVPLDVVEHIAADLGSFDLTNLCSAIPLFRPAADMLLRHPFIDDYRLLEVLPSMALDDPLQSKAFSAIHRGLFVPVLIVGEYGSSFHFHLGDEIRKVDYATGTKR